MRSWHTQPRGQNARVRQWIAAYHNPYEEKWIGRSTFGLWQVPFRLKFNSDEGFKPHESKTEKSA